MHDLGYDKDMRDRLNKLLAKSPERTSSQGATPSHHYSAHLEPRASTNFWTGFLACSVMFSTIGLGMMFANQAPKMPDPQPVPVPVISNPAPWARAIPPLNAFTDQPFGFNVVSAARSMITGFVDTNSLTASYYWTMTLHNSATLPQEAIMRMQIPAGATVSRATLWINGVPQEAAFASNPKVEHAYNWITRQHRDPLLIHQVAPNIIEIKASPVQPGQDMQFRIGITAPGTLDSSGQASFELPRMLNYGDVTQESMHSVHLESNSAVQANRTDVSSLKQAPNSFLVRANVTGGATRKFVITGARHFKKDFAVRATHSPAGTFVRCHLTPGDQGTMQMQMSKVVGTPQCTILNSEALAHRISALWAHNEIEQLASSGDWDQACDLANAYRVVSTVSGATVLEMDSDYTHENLNRDMERTVNYVPGTIASRSPITSVAPVTAMTAAPSNLGAGDQFASDASSAGDLSYHNNGGNWNTGSQTAVVQQMAPALQGATNGTIGPQGVDATVIQGVNTAGTVRVNRLANLESGLNLFANAGEVVGIGAGICMLLAAVLRKGKSTLRLSQTSLAILGTTLMVLGLTMPAIVNGLVASLRDANLFN